MARKNEVAVSVTGLKQTTRMLKEFPDAIDELKSVHQRIQTMVLNSARDRMPQDTGKLKASYKGGNIKGGAKITSSLPYAGVSEFGGSIPRRGTGAGRTQHKPKAAAGGLKSYYIYPAVDENRAEIVRIYEREIESLQRRYADTD